MPVEVYNILTSSCLIITFIRLDLAVFAVTSVYHRLISGFTVLLMSDGMNMGLFLFECHELKSPESLQQV